MRVRGAGQHDDAKMYWDAANLKATNAPQADPFIKGSYRAGWQIA